MESMNKFKVLTVFIICMFFFVIAAIYSNTKDASVAKSKNKTKAATEKIVKDSNQAVSAELTEDMIEVLDKVEILSGRMDDLSSKVDEQRSKQLNCRVYGVMTSNGPEELSTEAAIHELQANDNELVLTCSL